MAKAEFDLHEELTREDEVVGSSDRSFGLVVAAVAVLVGGFKWWHGSATGW